jgi:hypothetical protein
LRDADVTKNPPARNDYRKKSALHRTQIAVITSAIARHDSCNSNDTHRSIATLFDRVHLQELSWQTEIHRPGVTGNRAVGVRKVVVSSGGYGGRNQSGGGYEDRDEGRYRRLRAA